MRQCLLGNWSCWVSSCSFQVSTFSYVCPTATGYFNTREGTRTCVGGTPVGSDGCSPVVPETCGLSMACTPACSWPPLGGTSFCTGAGGPNTPATVPASYNDGQDCPPSG